ncbi:MAG: PTS sugar transporter subunit IIA [Calditrichaeota bacterium]|nr:PTS sugar transporter subunit IIA [Calditrichota bacterium]
MKLSEILQESLIKYPLKGTVKVEVIEELLEELVKNQLIRQRDDVLDAILERERLMTTGVGHGVAIPHCRTQLIQNFVIAIGVHPEGVDFESFDHKPAHIVFLLIGPNDQHGTHLRLLTRISRIISQPHVRDALLQLKTPAEIYQFLIDQESTLIN